MVRQQPPVLRGVLDLVPTPLQACAHVPAAFSPVTRVSQLF